MAKVEIYTKNWCPYCARAKALLRAKNVQYREVDVTTDEGLEQEMVERSGRSTVPQIFIDSVHIGGFDDLAELDATGDLDRLLGISAALDYNTTAA